MMIEMIINYDSDDDHNDNNDDDGDDDALQNISYQANDESGLNFTAVFTTQRSWNVFRWKYLLYFDHLWEECSIR